MESFVIPAYIAASGLVLLGLGVLCHAAKDLRVHVRGAIDHALTSKNYNHDSTAEEDRRRKLQGKN